MNSFPNENICPMFTIATKEEQGCAKELCAWWLEDKQPVLSEDESEDVE